MQGSNENKFCEYQNFEEKQKLRSTFAIAGVDVRRRKNDILKELFRKTIHICTAFVPLMLKYFYWFTITALFVVLILYIVAEALRYNGKNVPVISAITKAASRKRDENHFVMGPVCLAVGVLITSLVFDRESAAVGILALALGDGLASLVGKLVGKSYLYRMQGKTAEGSLACFLAIYVSSFCVTFSASRALIIASVGTIIELLPLKDYDNLVIPITLAALNQFVLFPLFTA